jgi:hypothetical protein
MRLRSFIHLTYHITCLMVLGVAPYHCDDCGLSHVKSLRFSCSGSHFHHLSTSPFPPLPHLPTSTAPQPAHSHRISAFLPPLHLPLSITSIHLHLRGSLRFQQHISTIPCAFLLLFHTHLPSHFQLHTFLPPLSSFSFCHRIGNSPPPSTLHLRRCILAMTTLLRLHFVLWRPATL